MLNGPTDWSEVQRLTVFDGHQTDGKQTEHAAGNGA